jgi:hypothetical protein
VVYDAFVKLALIALSLLAASCGPRVAADPDGGGGDDDGGQTGPHTLTGIEVTPTDSLVELDLNTPGSQAFTVRGLFTDGQNEDVTASATLEVINPAVGTLNGATLEIPAFPAVSVETSRIRATYEGFTSEAQITVVAYRKSGEAQDFFFVLPFEDAAGQQTKPLDFGTAVPALDLMMLMDTTGSMGPMIVNLQNALSNTIVPGIQGQVANSQFGVAAFDDFPIDPYGHQAGGALGACERHDQPLTLLRTITDNVPSVQTAVGQLLFNGSPAGCGNDLPEALIEALYQASTAQGLTGPSPTNVPATPVGFRPGTMPVFVSITDALSHTKGEGRSCAGGITTDYAGAVANAAHTRAEAKAAIANRCGRVVGIAPPSPYNASCSGQGDLEDFATASGARVPPAAWDVAARPANCAANQCCTGINGVGRAPDGEGLCPLVFLTDGQGSGVGPSIVTGIRMLTRFATFDVTSERTGVATAIDGTPLPAMRSTADFIKQVTPTGFTLPPAPPVVPNPTFDATSFQRVTPGTRVQFDVRAFNDFVPQTDKAQIFRAVIRVLAGGCTDLDQREVLILVPPTPIVIQ